MFVSFIRTGSLLGLALATSLAFVSAADAKSKKTRPQVAGFVKSAEFVRTGSFTRSRGQLDARKFFENLQLNRF